MTTRRRHAVIPILATALLLPCLIGLGFWQLDRSAGKRAIRDEMVARNAAPVTSLPATPVQASQWRFRRVQASGTWDTDHEFLVDNQVLDGRPGYHVLTPLRTSGTAVLVNRGWVPWGDDRRHLPSTPAPGGTVQVAGRVVEPAHEFFELMSESDTDGWSRLWQNLDLARYGERVDFAVQPVIIELAPDAAGGFKRKWREHDDGWVERHRGYAVQWFGLALTLVVINVVIWWRRRRTARHAAQENSPE